MSQELRRCRLVRSGIRLLGYLLGDVGLQCPYADESEPRPLKFSVLVRFVFPGFHLSLVRRFVSKRTYFNDRVFQPSVDSVL